MRIGCDLPYFTDPGAVRSFAQAAEEIGYHHLAFSEHVASAVDSPFPRGFSFGDPWHESFTMLGFLAGVTERIELATSMLLLPLRSAVLVAKQAAEIDLLTGQRLRLGAAVGWNGKEVAALGVDPATRGERMEEQIAVMRMLWTRDRVDFAGCFHDLDGVGISPRPRRSIPIWLGAGNFGSDGVPSAKALERIVRIADGYKMFAPLGAVTDLAMNVLDRLRQLADDVGRGVPIGVEARLLTNQSARAEWRDVASRWAEAGVSHLGLGNRIAGGTVDEQIALIADVHAAIGDLGNAAA
jgi:probable F420-dependent oxidoreductase